MLLTEKPYIDEALDLYKRTLGETITSSTHFGILENNILKATASVKCYSGHWYLRSCVVKPEFRGQGFQRELIKERLEYLASKTNVARVSIEPWDDHSINNVEQEGFTFEKTKKLSNGKVVLVYKRALI